MTRLPAYDNPQDVAFYVTDDKIIINWVEVEKWATSKTALDILSVNVCRLLLHVRDEGV